MKILVLLSLVRLSLEAANQRNYAKVVRIEYNQTGTTCKNPYARVRPVSRYDTLVNAGCDLQRPITGGFMNYKSWVRTSGSMNYRQVADLKNLEPCKILTSRNSFPAVNYLVERAKELYPNEVHDCPYTEFKVTNFSYYFLNDLTEEDKKWLFLPNGMYIAHVKVWDNTGDEAEIRLWTEAKFTHRMLTPPNWLWSGLDRN